MQGERGVGWHGTRHATVLRATMAALSFLALCQWTADPATASSERIFTIANFPVEASASSAVVAKKQALEEGRQAAFRSLLKRLVPVTSYPMLKKLRTIPTSSLIDGVSVRSEQNSATDYIATLDFSFQPLAIRQLLTKEGVPFLEEIAPQITVVPMLRQAQKGGTAIDAQDGSQAWHEAWRGLDLQNTLTPIKLDKSKDVIHPDTVNALAKGDTSAMRIVTGEYRTELIVMVIAEPDSRSGKLRVTMTGRDAVGPFSVERLYGGRSLDARYTMELAAVISQAIIEGRWKAIRTRMPAGAVSLSPSEAEAAVSIVVEFPQSLDRERVRAYWWKARRLLGSIDGVQDLAVGGLSADEANVRLTFPGGGRSLADELLRRGFVLRNAGGTAWRLLPSDRL